jgi:hypothetical protein
MFVVDAARNQNDVNVGQEPNDSNGQYYVPRGSGFSFHHHSHPLAHLLKRHSFLSHAALERSLYRRVSDATHILFLLTTEHDKTTHF